MVIRWRWGRFGTCADNAAMESFFSLLQKNVLNRRRRQQSLGRLTPVEFETLLNSTHAACPTYRDRVN